MPRSNERPTILQRLKALLQRLRRRSPPQDPYAHRLAPVRRGPKGRSGAAVAEPEEDSYNIYRPRALKRCLRLKKRSLGLGASVVK